MARAETIETVGEREVVGNGPLSCHNTCRMEVPRPLHAWPVAVVTTPRPPRSGSGAARHRYHRLEPLQVFNLSHPLASPRLEGQGEELRRVPPPPSPGSDRRSRGSGAQCDTLAEPPGRNLLKTFRNEFCPLARFTCCR